MDPGEADSLFLQIVGLVQHHCSLVAEVADSSGCVWDPMAPFPLAAMVYLVQRRNKVLLHAIQEEALEVLPWVCPAFFPDLVVHKAEEAP